MSIFKITYSFWLMSFWLIIRSFEPKVRLYAIFYCCLEPSKHLFSRTVLDSYFSIGGQQIRQISRTSSQCYAWNNAALQSTEIRPCSNENKWKSTWYKKDTEDLRGNIKRILFWAASSWVIQTLYACLRCNSKIL